MLEFHTLRMCFTNARPTKRSLINGSPGAGELAAYALKSGYWGKPSTMQDFAKLMKLHWCEYHQRDDHK